MEPRGCKHWQSVANWPRPKLAKTRDGKEGVDGSSPSEGFDKSPANARFGVCVQSVHGPLRAWMEPFMELSRRERALMRPDVPREWRAVAVSPRSL